MAMEKLKAGDANAASEIFQVLIICLIAFSLIALDFHFKFHLPLFAAGYTIYMSHFKQIIIEVK